MPSAVIAEWIADGNAVAADKAHRFSERVGTGVYAYWQEARVLWRELEAVELLCSRVVTPLRQLIVWYAVDVFSMDQRARMSAAQLTVRIEPFPALPLMASSSPRAACRSPRQAKLQAARGKDPLEAG